VKRAKSHPGVWPRHAFPILFGALLVLLAAYVGYLNHRITTRLGADPARARTRFFADRFRIVPGMDATGAAIFPRLERLGYRMDPSLSAPATWRRMPGGIEIRLRAFRDPRGELPERRAASPRGLAGGASRSRAKRAARQVTLEPMRLDATWAAGGKAASPCAWPISHRTCRVDPRDGGRASTAIPGSTSSA
jgi:hypothetical protein